MPALYGRPIEMVHTIIDGKAGQLLARQIEQRLSAHVIGPWLDLGFFNWYSTSKPLNGYDDLKGLKIRNSGGAGRPGGRSSWARSRTPRHCRPCRSPFRRAHSTGIITSFETIVSGQFWESGIRHALEDHQFVGEYVPVMSLAFWQKLPPDLQQSVTDLWR